MKYIKQSMTFKIEEPTVLSLGKFDGLHRGHELLMKYMADKKREQKTLKSAVFTFDIPPLQQVQGTQTQVITTSREKERLFQEAGVDYVIECPFTQEIMRMEPEEFIERIAASCQVRFMVTGADFRFGYMRRGDYRMLREFAPRLGYELKVVDKMQEDGREISSTFVREEISAGNIQKANKLLGYAFFLEGEVCHGRKMGKRVLGIPTINLIPPKEKLLPPPGVYITETEWNGKLFQGITNVGYKPTIQGENPLGVETHLFHATQDLYGENVRVSFQKRLRPEKKFDSLDALREQMQKDIQCGIAYFNTGKGVQKN